MKTITIVMYPNDSIVALQTNWPLVRKYDRYGFSETKKVPKSELAFVKRVENVQGSFGCRSIDVSKGEIRIERRDSTHWSSVVPHLIKLMSKEPVEVLLLDSRPPFSRDYDEEGYATGEPQRKEPRSIDWGVETKPWVEK